MKKQQQGSAHAVVIVCLVAALLFALGWIFYQNFILKQDNKEPDETISKVDTTSTSKAYCVSTVKVCFDELKDWTVTKTTDQYPAEGSEAWKDNGNKAEYTIEGAEATFSSPDSLPMTLTLATGYSQLGGGCVPEDVQGQTIEVIDVAATKLEGAVDQPRKPIVNKEVVAVKAIINQKGKFMPAIFLTQLKELSQKGTKTVCSMMYGLLVEGKNKPADGGSALMTFASYKDVLGIEPDIKDKYNTREEAVKALGSDSFNRGFNVLKSVRYQ